MQDSDLHITIENYLLNKMTKAERNAFESTIETNEFIRNEVKMHKQINSILLDSHLLDVSLSLKQYHTKSINRIKAFKTLTIIVFIVLISAIVLYTLLNPKKTINQKNIAPNEAVSYTNKKNLLPKSIENNKKQNNPFKSTSKESMISNTQSIVALNTQSSSEKSINHTNNLQENTILLNTNHFQLTASEPCAQSNIHAEFTTHGTCFNKQEGEIQILKIAGGDGAYRTEVFDNHNNIYSRTHLKHGTYNLKITDQNNCTKIYESIVVESINCKEEYVFNPSIGETWNIPAYSSNGIIQIVSKNGTVLYKNTLLANEEYTWNGVAQNGNIEYGLHSFIIQYKDGHVLNGTITVVE